MAESANTASPFPCLCGPDAPIADAMSRRGPVFLHESGIDFSRIHAGFALALHMHQPLIPAGEGGGENAPIVSNLEHMLRSGDDGARYNAGVYQWCYRRMGEMIPALVEKGARPRVMLDYSGCLLHGFRLMGLNDVIDALKLITTDPRYRRCVEWLGSAWGHPVAPSTPVQDYRLHVRAWQHEFASIFGLEALSRIRGFSPAEMALPNHPDVAYEFVRTLIECGYRWVLVQEHTVERLADGGPIDRPHLPHRLVATNSLGQTASITAIIKTQGSDTKLVAQLQPYYEAKGLSRAQLAGKLIPPLVTQISDGENGGVMMNEFPPKFEQAMPEASASASPPLLVSEYLEYLASLGLREEDFIPIRPVHQKRLWDRFEPGAGPEAMAKVIRELEREDGRFHMEGGSWTGNISWVKGYASVLDPMQQASARFAEKITARGVPLNHPECRNALYHLLMSQTSCFRYWGGGVWTDYGKELCRRTMAALDRDFKDTAAWLG